MTKKHVKKSQKTRKKGVFLAKKVEKTCFLVFFRVFPCFQGVEKHECAHYVHFCARYLDTPKCMFFTVLTKITHFYQVWFGFFSSDRKKHENRWKTRKKRVFCVFYVRLKQRYLYDINNGNTIFFNGFRCFLVLLPEWVWKKSQKVWKKVKKHEKTRKNTKKTWKNVIFCEK